MVCFASIWSHFRKITIKGGSGLFGLDHGPTQVNKFLHSQYKNSQKLFLPQRYILYFVGEILNILMITQSAEPYLYKSVSHWSE